MPNEVLGIIAGIGDKSSNRNVITPQFDAKIRKFIIGKNAILSGLEIVGDTLTSGMCIAEGYPGELPQSVNIPNGTSYIYAKYIINHNSDVLDGFEIVFATGALNYTNDDILHSDGIYYLLLYKNGKKQLDLLYPYKSENSDNATNIVNGGALGNNVTGITAPLNSANKMYATTEFVRNQIEEEIGYKNSGTITNEFSFTAHNILFGDINVKIQFTYRAVRKSKLCVFNMENKELSHVSNSAAYYVNAGTVILTLPEEYRPKNDIEVLHTNIGIKTNGDIYFINDWAVTTDNGIPPTIKGNAGYETV